jgi:murein DD-endopeptidase MepM/ murein hydrolase activator NlpD
MPWPKGHGNRQGPPARSSPGRGRTFDRRSPRLTLGGMRPLPLALPVAALLLGTAPAALAAPAPATGTAPGAKFDVVLAVAENGLPEVETAVHFSPPTTSAPFAVGVWPSIPFQGAVLVVDVVAPGIRSASATFAGKAFRFYRFDGDTLRGVAPVPDGAKPGPATLAVTAEWSDGKVRRKATREIPLGVAAVDFPSDSLRVDPKFTKLSAAAKRQIARDREKLRTVWKDSPDRPLFTRAFLKPREDRTTAPYGTRRTFNGAVKSVHAGWDIDGDVGAPVLCTNDGVVRHAGDLYYSGGTLIVDHGLGIYSAYFHLSGYLVKEGDRVTRGQPCALVGDTGRVTGPHLHFGAKVGGSYIHPEALLRFDFARPLLPAPAGGRVLTASAPGAPAGLPTVVLAPGVDGPAPRTAAPDPCAELRARLAERKDWLARTAAERNTLAHVTDPEDFAALLQLRTMQRCAEHPSDPDCAPPPIEVDVAELQVPLSQVSREPGELALDDRSPDEMPHDPVVRDLENRLRRCAEPERR